MQGFPRFLLRLAAILPLPVLHAVGTVLGWAVYGISPTYRANLRANLAQAGYADSGTRRAAIAAAGQMLAELPALWFRPHEKVRALVREASGVEAAYAARERGQALLLLTPHLGCFEITAQYAARRMPITVLYRPPRLGWLEPLMREGRERPNVRLVPADLTGVREVFAALRRGEAVGFLPDQVPGVGEGEWAEFFGRPARRAQGHRVLSRLRAADAARRGLFARAARAAAASAGRDRHAPPQPRARSPGARVPGAVPVELQPLQDAERREAA